MENGLLTKSCARFENRLLLCCVLCSSGRRDPSNCNNSTLFSVTSGRWAPMYCIRLCSRTSVCDTVCRSSSHIGDACCRSHGRQSFPSHILPFNLSPYVLLYQSGCRQRENYRFFIFSSVDLTLPLKITSFNIATGEMTQVVGLSRWKAEIDLDFLQRFKAFLDFLVCYWSRRLCNTRSGYCFGEHVCVLNNNPVGIDCYDRKTSTQ